MSRSPAVILYDAAGVAMAVADGAAIPTNTRGVLGAGKDSAGNAKILYVDRYYNALVIMDLHHSRIHDGKHFCCENWASVSGAGTTFDLLMKTGVARPHVVYGWESTVAFSYTLYEAPTITADGTAETVHNSNRGSSTVPGASLYYGPTVTAVGTRLLSGQISSDFKAGGSHTREDELILALGTSYLLRFTKTDAGSGELGYSLAWYES